MIRLNGLSPRLKLTLILTVAGILSLLILRGDFIEFVSLLKDC